MADLSTKYLGINLKNPIILGACNLVTNIDNIKKAEEAGAAAIVYKSLFEEQIQLESAQLDDAMDEYAERNAEMISLFPRVEHAGPEEHLMNIQKTKEALSIPVIASLNAIYNETWVDYAQQIEKTGVDALELNFYFVPREADMNGEKIYMRQLEVLQAVRKNVKIPVSVKLSPFYANPLNVISQMDKQGVNGFVIFNRLFQPDINLKTEKHYNPYTLSAPEDSRLSLRFTGLLYGKIKADICSNTGIYTGEDVAKMILAGADCVQSVSTVYKNNIDHISKMIAELNAWMESKNYKKLSDFKGNLSNKNINDPFVYKRAQYIDMLLKSDEIFKKYSPR